MKDRGGVSDCGDQAEEEKGQGVVSCVYFFFLGKEGEEEAGKRP